MSNEKQGLNPLVEVFGQKNAAKYDMVFIIGYDNPAEEIARVKAEAKASGLSICIIGDGGEESFLSKRLLTKTLKDKIDDKTSIYILAHSRAERLGHDSYKALESGVYPESKNRETRQLLKDLKDIFDLDQKNKDKKMPIELMSCHGGAVKNHIPDDVNATLHGGQKFSTFIPINCDTVINDIKARAKSNICNPYKSFMDNIILSPETMFYVENGLTLKYSAPKQPLFGQELERYLISEITRFLEFRLDTLKHSVKDVFGFDALPAVLAERKELIAAHIASNKKQFSITPETLTKYNENALLIECFRNSKSAPIYIAKSAPLTDNIADDKHINVNAATEDGITSLFMAAHQGHTDVVKSLIAAKADVNKATKYYDTTPLHIAAQMGKTDVVKTLMASNAKVNLQNNNGYSPLFIAAENGYTDVVKSLAANADVNLQNNNGYSPLFIAAENGRTDVVKYLITANADVNLKNNNGSSPLYAAAYNGHTDVVKSLIAAKADVNLKNNNGRPPLYAAAYNGHTDVVKSLITANADVNLKNNNGRPPLYAAAYNGHTDVVKSLIAAKADVNLQNNNGSSPLYTAVDNGHTDVVKTLIAAKADVYLPNKKGETPLMIAVSNGDKKITELLLPEITKVEHLVHTLRTLTAKGITVKPEITKLIYASINELSLEEMTAKKSQSPIANILEKGPNSNKNEQKSINPENFVQKLKNAKKGDIPR
jgi:ankyrin repeat protein